MKPIPEQNYLDRQSDELRQFGDSGILGDLAQARTKCPPVTTRGFAYIDHGYGARAVTAAWA
jgi:hypothetical protein